ncbi:MAG: biotin-dependent carboxyltransferase family protein [Campylobacterota bacterium]
MSFKILNEPIFATIQDRGRFGFTNIGVTNSGVMDEYAYLSANLLLNNSLDTNIIEIAFSNVILKALKPTKIAITGAKCDFFINDIKKNIWQTYSIKKDDILKIGKITNGVRVYLAIKDGFNIKKEFKSNATTIKESLGGLDGSKLKKNQILPYDSYTSPHNARFKKELIPRYKESLELRVVLCYQDNYFSKEQKKRFFNSTYEVTNEFNRMGCKLKGEPIRCDIEEIVSEGISFGAIQIPSDGQPIILLKDRQTIGGYPKIGAVLGVDCFKLAQAKPNTKVSFKAISLQEAQKLTKKFYEKFYSI